VVTSLRVGGEIGAKAAREIDGGAGRADLIPLSLD
jgi:hypothetical protein